MIRDDRVLLSGFEEEDGGPFSAIPGGGVEDGETPHTAVAGELARVWKDGRREHCFLLDAVGDIGALEELGHHGGVPVWGPVAQLAVTPIWPRRLASRIPDWQARGWQGRAADCLSAARMGRSSGWRCSECRVVGAGGGCGM
ncbi:hypothetical protein [Streptomyces sp. NPDC058613]|uniref:hypothetical protein n=1 Tax=Streptomyces sp. NPDC058613 TaxID=3346556 RepID=UPI0036630178